MNDTELENGAQKEETQEKYRREVCNTPSTQHTYNPLWRYAEFVTQNLCPQLIG